MPERTVTGGWLWLTRLNGGHAVCTYLRHDFSGAQISVSSAVMSHFSRGILLPPALRRVGQLAPEMWLRLRLKKSVFAQPGVDGRHCKINLEMELRYLDDCIDSRRRTQVVRDWSAKPLFSGSNPLDASSAGPSCPAFSAQVVEQVDTRDLKSLGLYARTGSIPVLGTKKDRATVFFLYAFRYADSITSAKDISSL